MAERERVTRREICRLCDGRELTRVWSFGETPLANNYLLPDEVGRRDELMVPLDVYRCEGCSLVQLLDVVHPDALFAHYLYVSSTSPVFVKHFVSLAEMLRKRFELHDGSLVIDVGSNDGVLLRPLQEAGVEVLGVDPARNVAQEATEEGIETWPEYFTPSVAERVVAERGRADVVTANNVFAHTDRIDVFMEALDMVLAHDGVFVFEVQYLGKLLADNLFDVVYHEHVNYYHLTPLVTFFEKRGWQVFDVEQPAVHGGSLRVFVSRKDSLPRVHETAQRESNERVRKLLTMEERAGLNESKPYHQFAQRVVANKEALRALLEEAKAAGNRVVGFGAPAKATTLMYAFGLTGDDVEYIVDDAPLKQGRVMPGTHVPIVGAERLYEDPPDYVLVLAWNFAEPIMEKHAKLREHGTQFIVPVPKPRIQ